MVESLVVEMDLPARHERRIVCKGGHPKAVLPTADLGSMRCIPFPQFLLYILWGSILLGLL